MVCIECGMENREGNAFCTNCGCRMKQVSVQDICAPDNTTIFKRTIFKKWWFWMIIALNIFAIAVVWYPQHKLGHCITYYHGKSELYYTSNVTKDEAQRLGSYLVKQNFFVDDEYSTVQLNKKGNSYEFRFVVKDGSEKDEEYAKACRQFGRHLSKNVFDGKPVDVHFCDEHFKTVRVLGYN